MVKPKKEQVPLDELRLQVERLSVIWESLDHLDEDEDVVGKRLDKAENDLKLAEAEMIRFFA